MRGTVSIGDFSRMTHLSVKTLRHYHDVGLLVPAETDKMTGYRYYAKSQVPVAQVIRRFRALDMPVEEVRAILATSDPEARSKLIAAHLDRLERQLKETHAAVASLRALLERPEAPIRVEHRAVRQSPTLAISERIRVKEVTAWMTAAYAEIYDGLRSQGSKAAGPSGALWSTEVFTEGEGDATVFVPVGGEVRPVGRARPHVVPPRSWRSRFTTAPIRTSTGRTGRLARTSPSTRSGSMVLCGNTISSIASTPRTPRCGPRRSPGPSFRPQSSDASERAPAPPREDAADAAPGHRYVHPATAGMGWRIGAKSWTQGNAQS